MNRLSELELEGFKSIRKLQLALRPINVFIGANGSGKSNLLSFFKMLNYMMTEGLDIFVGKAGGANALLYYGSKTTPEMSFRLGFETDRGWNEYFARLVSAAGDTLIFADERIKYVPKEKPDRPPVSLGAGHRNTLLAQEDLLDRRVVRTAKTIRSLMSTWRFYQFHDTSENSNMRKHASVHENRWLMHDGGNLASLLYWMRETHPAYYRRIVLTIRRVAPFFDDFTLEPSRWNENKIILEWKEIGSESVFTVHQLSDGTLRFIALATLLLQPYPPALMVIDEPELGLHPHAISVLAELIKAAGETSQILVSTQSVTLVNEFEPEDVIVVERSQGESLFRRLNGDELANWLEEYSLGDLWMKNVIGGGPSR